MKRIGIAKVLIISMLMASVLVLTTSCRSSVNGEVYVYGYGDYFDPMILEDFEEENFDFFVHRRQDDFYLNLTYNTKEYSEVFVQRFMADYAKVMHALAAGRNLKEIVAML